MTKYIDFIINALLAGFWVLVLYKVFMTLG
jgi:hypothetical protein